MSVIEVIRLDTILYHVMEVEEMIATSHGVTTFHAGDKEVKKRRIAVYCRQPANQHMAI